MSKIEINNCVYNVHSTYDLYAADINGNIINIIKKVPNKGRKNNCGYMLHSVRKHGQNGQKTFQVHRFVWECFNGLIPDGKVIDHINEIKDDNRLCNLQLVTQRENVKKSVKNRDYSFLRKNPRCVKATEIDTGKVVYYQSMYAAKQHLSVNTSEIHKCCNGTRKSSTSKKDGQCYIFEYIKKEDLPDDHIKSSNLRQNLSDDEKKKHNKEAVNKWQKKEYICPKCDKKMTMMMRYKHRKKCN